MLKNSIKKVFTLRSFVLLFLFVSISFILRTLIINLLDLNLSVYHEYILAIVPSALLAKLGKEIGEAWLGEEKCYAESYNPNTFKLSGSKPSSIIPLNNYSNRAGAGRGVGGTGTSAGAEAGPSNSDIKRSLQAAKENYELEQEAKRQAEEQGGLISDRHFKDYSRKMMKAQEGQSMPSINQKQAEQELEKTTKYNASLQNYATSIAKSLNDFIQHSPAPEQLVTVEDPTGIGARGYNPNLSNQPYAKNIANNPEVLNAKGKSYYPDNLDPNAKRFLVDALRDNLGDVYGPNPTRTKVGMISGEVIKMLKKLP